MFKKVALAVAVALAAQGAAAASIDFHGYTRQGVGTSKGGGQQCFALDKTKKFRLGNECDNYSELSFTTKLYKAENAWFNYNLRLATTNMGTQDYEGTTQDGDKDPKGNAFRIASRENFVEGGGFMGDSSFFKEAKVWLGKRFYQRHDVHINDMYYWDASGNGVGLEGMNPGLGKLHIAYFQNSSIEDDFTSKTKVNMSRYDVRWSDVPLWTDGKLELGFGLNRATINENINSSGDIEGTGYVLNAELTQTNLLGGFNKFVLQYGKGYGAPFRWTSAGAYARVRNQWASDVENWKNFRLIDHFAFQFTPEASLSGVFVYDKADGGLQSWGGNDGTEVSAGLRFKYAFTENLAVNSEFGINTWKGAADGSKKQRLTKFTIAPTITGGKGFWARPELRLFATYAAWNDAAAAGDEPAVGEAAHAFGTDKKNGLSYGAQVEAWW